MNSRTSSTASSGAEQPLIPKPLSSSDDLEALVAAISTTAITIGKQYEKLIEQYNKTLDKKTIAENNYSNAIGDLITELKSITRQSSSVTPEALEGKGVIFSKDSTINLPELNQHLQGRLYTSLNQLNTAIKSTTLIEESAYRVAQSISEYLTTICIDYHVAKYIKNREQYPGREQDATEAGTTYAQEHISTNDSMHWLCITTDIHANINIDKIGEISLNEDQINRISELARAFIRGKTPSLQLLKYCDDHEQLREAYQLAIAQSLEPVISNTYHPMKAPRFYKIMESLPQIIQAQPNYSAADLTSHSNDKLDQIATWITAYIIQYLTCVKPGIDAKTLASLRQSLPKELVLTAFSEISKTNLINKPFTSNQIKSLTILLEGVTPLTRIPDMNTIPTTIKTRLDEKAYGRHLLSENSRRAFQTLPQAIQLVLGKPNASTSLESTQLIPAELLRNLQLRQDLSTTASNNPLGDTEVIESLLTPDQSETADQKTQRLQFLQTKSWITAEQATSMQETTPAFGASPKAQSTNQLIHALLETLEENPLTRPNDILLSVNKIIQKSPDDTKVLKDCSKTITPTDSLKSQKTEQHTQAAKELKNFHDLAQKWITLAKAGATQYLHKIEGKWFRSEGRERATSFIDSLNGITIQSIDDASAFNQLKNLFENQLITFNGGSLGTYILESLTGDSITENTKEAPLTDSYDAMTQATNNQYKKINAPYSKNPQFKDKNGPNGKSTTGEIIWNSHMSSYLWRQTADHKQRQSGMQFFCNQFEELNTHQQSITAAA